MIVRPMPPERYSWLAERAKICIGPQLRAIEAVTDDGRLAGAVGFDGWTNSSVSLHIALESPIALRSLIAQGFGLAFTQLKKRIATVTVLSTNKRSLRLVEGLGFHHVFTGRDYWDVGVDLTVWEMRREECRWIGNQAESRAQNTEREAA